MSEKYALTSENCVSEMTCLYKYQPELILMKFSRQFDFLASQEYCPIERERLIRIMSAFENLAKRIKNECSKCHRKVIESNGILDQGKLVCADCALKEVL